MPRTRRRSDARNATPIDAHVGDRIRARRIELGLSQSALAEASRITFQQIQKYENGANRVSASRLWQFAAILDVPVDFFFAELGRNMLTSAAAKRIDENRRDGVARNSKLDAETIRLAGRIARLDPDLRKKLKGMLSAFAGA